MHRFRIALFLAALALMGAPVALHAQQAAPSFSPTGQTTLSVTTASGRVAFATPGPTALIINTGANAAYLKFGGSTVTATTSNYLLNPGCAMAWDVNGQGYVAAITGSSTTTLSVATGGGVPTLQNSGCSVTLSGTVVVSGTVTANQGTAGASAWPVKIDQTTPGTTNGVQVNAALPAGTNVIGVTGNTQGSTTSGQSGPLAQGAVTTSAPSYTTAQTSPLSLTTSGGLRVDGSGSTQPVSGSVTVVQPTGTNLHAVLDTTSTTAVTQATASNLNATVVGTGTFAVQASISPSSASTAGVAPVQSSSVETGHVIKASGGNLYDFNVSADATLSAVTWAALIFNSTTVPAAGAVTPVRCYIVPAGTTSISGSFQTPMYLGTGISIAVSTGATCFTKTDSAHAFISAGAQ